MPERSATGARIGIVCSLSPLKSPKPGGRVGSCPPRGARPNSVADRITELAKDDSIVARFIDYRVEGPGTLPEIFDKAEAIVCTEDSSTMISEAVSARLPVVGVAPAKHRFTDDEAEYRSFLIRNNWCQVLPIAALTPDSFAKALAEIETIEGNPLDALAAKLKERLPQLFRAG